VNRAGLRKREGRNPFWGGLGTKSVWGGHEMVTAEEEERDGRTGFGCGKVGCSDLGRG